MKLGCSWCVDFGTVLIKHEGLDVDRLKEIHDYRTSDKCTELEKLALAYADAMTETPRLRSPTSRSPSSTGGWATRGWSS